MSPSRLFLLVVPLQLVLVGSAVRAGPETGAASAPVERFLFVVETSVPMQSRAENTQKLVAHIIASGLNGQMGSRASLGLWLFNDRLVTGTLPAQTWTPATSPLLARTFAQVLQQQRHEHAPQLSVIWEAATTIISKSDHLTLLLVTSGENAVRGTPCDETIAATFKENRDQQRQTEMPFVIILRAVKGRIVACSVSTPPWPLEIPEYPEADRLPLATDRPPVRPPPATAPPLIIKQTDLAPPPADFSYYLPMAPDAFSNQTALTPARTNQERSPSVAAPAPGTPPPVATNAQAAHASPARPQQVDAPQLRLRRTVFQVGGLLVFLLVIMSLRRRRQRRSRTAVFARSTRPRPR